MTADHFQFLTTVLENLNDGTVNWGEVAKARGINRKDNATTGFKNMMKKYGVDYANNKFTPIADFDRTSIGMTSTTKQNTPSTPRKRKVTEADTEAEGKKHSPTKKKKAAVANNDTREPEELKNDD